MLDELLALLVPPRCPACRGPAARQVLCSGCRRQLPWLRSLRCERCAQPVPCGPPCPAQAAAFDAAWSAVAYDGVARDAVHALKRRGARPLATVMAAQIAAGAPPGLIGGTLVAVPSHPHRTRARGYDPAAVLATALARRTGLPLARHALRRHGPAVRQAGARRAERLAEGRLQIVARRPVPATIVLVDDVHTTGATLHAASVALRAAGARRVVAITWARTLDEGRR